MSHYYTNDETLKHEYYQYDTIIDEMDFSFHTDAGVFSKSGLDFGTRVLLETLDLQEQETTILDMGCGYGPIGIYVGKKYPQKKITMVDVNLRALDLAKQNLVQNNTTATVIESNLFDGIVGLFDVIISNPPIRTGKQNLYTFYKTALTYLNLNGKLWLVVAKKQGAESTIDYLKTLYTKVNVLNKHKGYFIICAQK